MAKTPWERSAALTLPKVKRTRPSFGSCRLASYAASWISVYLLIIFCRVFDEVTQLAVVTEAQFVDGCAGGVGGIGGIESLSDSGHRRFHVWIQLCGGGSEHRC